MERCPPHRTSTSRRLTEMESVVFSPSHTNNGRNEECRGKRDVLSMARQRTENGERDSKA
jgi:hypothetical protein